MSTSDHGEFAAGCEKRSERVRASAPGPAATSSPGAASEPANQVEHAECYHGAQDEKVRNQRASSARPRPGSRLPLKSVPRRSASRRAFARATISSSRAARSRSARRDSSRSLRATSARHCQYSSQRCSTAWRLRASSVTDWATRSTSSCPGQRTSIADVQVLRLHDLGAWIATHGEAVIGAHPAPKTVDFYGPATMHRNRLYLHLVAQPVENIVVRGIPVRRVRRVSLLGADQALCFRLPLAHTMTICPGSTCSPS